MLLDNSTRHFSRAVYLLVFVIALFSAATVINGDSLGRVNLLYALLLFVFWPLLSLLTSLLSLLFKSKNSMSLFLFRLPLWPTHWSAELATLRRHELLKPWLMLQSQSVSLSFSSGCLCAFVGVLLFSDVTFIWRSTLLQAEQIFTLLQWIALPWSYLPSAQPLIEGVALAQDSRLAINTSLNGSISWQFLLMAQLTYAIGPRLVALFWARSRFLNAQRNATEAMVVVTNTLTGHQAHTSNTSGARVVTSSAKYMPFVLLSNQKLPPHVVKLIEDTIGVAQCFYDLSVLQNEANALLDKRDKLLVVAAWEPPLGELADFMEHSNGELLPLDWNAQQLKELTQQHFDEWSRFCHTQPSWQLTQLSTTILQEER